MHYVLCKLIMEIKYGWYVFIDEFSLYGFSQKNNLPFDFSLLLFSKNFAYFCGYKYLARSNLIQ